jgi:predicted RNA-binding Zn-ribbon protein involved in translation (DUF1610 family)
MEWKYCDIRGKEVDKNIGFQKDTAGNILFQSGQVSSKACQNCGDKFIEKRNQDEVKQNIDKYICTKCKFESHNPQEAIIHTLKDSKHKLKVKEDFRIVGYSNTLSGTPCIEFKGNDCVILCKKCYELN